MLLCHICQTLSESLLCQGEPETQRGEKGTVIKSIQKGEYMYIQINNKVHVTDKNTDIFNSEHSSNSKTHTHTN